MKIAINRAPARAPGTAGQHSPIAASPAHASPFDHGPGIRPNAAQLLDDTGDVANQASDAPAVVQRMLRRVVPSILEGVGAMGQLTRQSHLTPSLPRMVPRRDIHTVSMTTPKTTEESLQERDKWGAKGVSHFMYPDLPRLPPVTGATSHDTGISAVNRHPDDPLEHVGSLSERGFKDVLMTSGAHKLKLPGDPSMQPGTQSPVDVMKEAKSQFPHLNMGAVVNPHAPPDLFAAEMQSKEGADYLHTEPVGHPGNIHPDNLELMRQFSKTKDLHVGVNAPEVGYKSGAPHQESTEHPHDPSSVMDWALQEGFHTYSQSHGANDRVISADYVHQQDEQNPLKRH
jgi:hypothetical protein